MQLGQSFASYSCMSCYLDSIAVWNLNQSLKPTKRCRRTPQMQRPKGQQQKPKSILFVWLVVVPNDIKSSQKAWSSAPLLSLDIVIKSWMQFGMSKSADEDGLNSDSDDHDGSINSLNSSSIVIDHSKCAECKGCLKARALHRYVLLLYTVSGRILYIIPSSSQ